MGQAVQPETWKNRIVSHADVEPSQLLAHEWNFRRHPRTQQDALSGLIDELGFTSPVLVQHSTGKVIDGHLRVELAMRSNQPTIPVTYLDLTDDEAALALATTDPVSAMAYHDAEQLRALLDEVSTSDAAVMQMLSELAESAGIVAEPPALLTDPDEVPPLPSEPITKPGDLWILGRHRLLCGDATVVTDVERLMDGEKAQLIATDPPYNVGFDYEGAYKGQDKKTDDHYGEWLWSAIEPLEAMLSPGSLCFVWQGMLNCRRFHEWFPRDFRIFASVKGMVQFRPTPVQFSWDPVVFWQTDGPSSIQVKAGRRDYFVSNTATWLQTDGPEKGGHPCPRPLDAVAYIIEEFSKTDDLVVDPFLGSGTTVIAAEKMGRRCYGIELEPKYCDVIVKRFENATGQTATRAALASAVA